MNVPCYSNIQKSGLPHLALSVFTLSKSRPWLTSNAHVRWQLTKHKLIFLSLSLSLFTPRKKKEGKTEQNRIQLLTSKQESKTTQTTAQPSQPSQPSFRCFTKKKRIKTSQDSNHPLPYIHLHRHNPQIYYAHDTNSFPTATRM